jgi:ABC-type amino acid transport substrate-binding protein
VPARRTEARRAGGPALAALLVCALSTPAARGATLTVCMAADNPPLSYLAAGQPRGLDLRIARAAADALGRELVVVPFESEYEKESTLAQEVNALLSAGVCEAASGFPLLSSDFGPPVRPNARTPDYPGAKRKRERPFVPLGTLVAGRAYQSVVLGAVLRSGSAPLASLADLGDRKLGATSGTLAGAMLMAWRHGALRKQTVSLGQREDALAELAQPAPPGGARFDALVLPLALVDGWRLQHPDAPLVVAAWRRPIGIHLGFVTLPGAAEARAALDGVVVQALADGRLARWAAEEGVSWAAPGQPELSPGPSMADLAAD